jgi:hypothetical protein
MCLVHEFVETYHLVSHSLLSFAQRRGFPCLDFDKDYLRLYVVVRKALKTM